jgi:hypothetical protein
MEALTSIVGVRDLYLIWDAPFCSHGQVWELSSAKSGKTHVDRANCRTGVAAWTLVPLTDTSNPAKWSKLRTAALLLAARFLRRWRYNRRQRYPGDATWEHAMDPKLDHDTWKRDAGSEIDRMMFLQEGWWDCDKFRPYRDYRGRWQIPRNTQRRRTSRGTLEYRERAQTNS